MWLYALATAIAEHLNYVDRTGLLLLHDTSVLHLSLQRMIDPSMGQR